MCIRDRIQTVHRGCDHLSNPVLVCDHCGQRVGPRDMLAISGPGRVSELDAVRRNTTEFERRRREASTV